MLRITSGCKETVTLPRVPGEAMTLAVAAPLYSLVSTSIVSGDMRSSYRSERGTAKVVTEVSCVELTMELIN